MSCEGRVVAAEAALQHCSLQPAACTRPVSPHGSELLKFTIRGTPSHSQQSAAGGSRRQREGTWSQQQWVAAGDLLRWLHRKNAVRTGTLSTTDHYLIQDSYYIPPNWDHHIEHAFYR